MKASNTEASDNFGRAVALAADGNTLAVSAWGEDSNFTGVDNVSGIDSYQADNSDALAGAVYVFINSSGTWSQQAYVKASNTDPNDYFGSALALSADGSTLAVGAYAEASNAIGIDYDTTGTNPGQSYNYAGGAGAVYVFARSSGLWSQQAYVKASNTDLYDYFGSALALSADGNILAVGAWGEASSATGVGGDQSDNSVSGAGAVYVLTRGSGLWSQQAYVKASNTDANDIFGRALALSADGNNLAVGAWGEASKATGVGGDQSDNSVSGAGAVYVY